MGFANNMIESKYFNDVYFDDIDEILDGLFPNCSEDDISNILDAQYSE